MTSETTRSERAKAIKFRHTIESANIIFEGITLSEVWPESHAKLFQKVHDEQFTGYQAYMRNAALSPDELKATTKRVKALVNATTACRKQLDLEREWRNAVEYRILHRFATRLNCSTCGLRLWTAEMKQLQAVESNEQPHRKVHPMCFCTSEDRIDRFEAGSEQIFRDKSENLVNLWNEDRVADGDRKPDRVIGLYPTKTLRQLKDLHTDLRHGPFNDFDQVVYPFLVLEAKSDYGAEGIEHAEAQTAFPIKTFLKIQEQLMTLSNDSFEPLLWFIAYAGDQAHVYGCVVEDARYRIFDLWQGCIRSYDRALQLLNISDFICEWAAKRFRRDVMSCLAGGRDLRHEFSDTITTLSYEPASSQVPLRFESDELLEESEQLYHHSSFDGQDAQFEDALNGQMDRIDPWAAVEAPVLPVHTEHFDAVDGTSHSVTIRHVDHVKLIFCQTLIPATDLFMKQWLKDRPAPANSLESRQIIRSLLSGPICIPTTLTGVDVLRHQWLGGSTIVEPEEAQRCFCLVKFTTFADVSSGQFVRRLDCVVLTEANLHGMMQVIRSTFHEAEIVLPPVHDCVCLRELANTFLSFDRREATHAALMCKSAVAVRPNYFPGIRCNSWQSTQYATADLHLHHSYEALQSMLEFFCSNHGFESSTTKIVSTSRVLPRHLQPYFRAPQMFASLEQIILQGKPGNGPRGDEFCVMVLTDLIYDYKTYRLGLTHRIRDCILEGSLFHMSGEGNRSFTQYRGNDRDLLSRQKIVRTLDHWLYALRLEFPSDLMIEESDHD